MTRSPKLSATLVLALTAVAVTAYAYTTSESSKAQTAANDAAAPVTVNVDEHAMAPVADEHPAAPAASQAPAPATPGNTALVPDIEHYSLPPVTVTAPRPSEDELLRNAVVDRLASDARLSGKIGVESYRHVVSLTGRVTNRAQIERAVLITRGVDGVRDVNNYLLARVGES